jgi:hypothetical protein
VLLIVCECKHCKHGTFPRSLHFSGEVVGWLVAMVGGGACVGVCLNAGCFCVEVACGVVGVGVCVG